MYVQNMEGTVCVQDVECIMCVQVVEDISGVTIDVKSFIL